MGKRELPSPAPSMTVHLLGTVQPYSTCVEVYINSSECFTQFVLDEDRLECYSVGACPAPIRTPTKPPVFGPCPGMSWSRFGLGPGPAETTSQTSDADL